MPDLITVTGLVATTPKNIVTSTGLAITTFRLASNQRKFDKAEGKWVTAETNWFTVATFRQLAANVLMSLQKGQRIVVTGKLRVREWSSDDKNGISVEIAADAIGHDLAWGTAAFTRSAMAAIAEAEGEAPEGEPAEVPSADAGEEPFTLAAEPGDEIAAATLAETHASETGEPVAPF
ncbi:MAG TPA: single-stranded DNA-binding protein [Pseudolysinimonas sp.]|nr:single-stranded DNA-binding protein [Pseudolysinimonas sp.]